MNPQAADPRRADPRHRRRRQGRDPDADPRARRPGPGRADDLLRARGGDRGAATGSSCCATAARVAELDREPRSREPAVMAAMAHGDAARGGRMAEAAAPPGRAAPAAASPRGDRPARATAPWSRSLLLILFNLAVTPNFADLADPQRQPHPGLHHRHRRRRHDAGDRHRRHRPLGRLADGDRRRAGAADLPGQARSRCRTRWVGVALAFVAAGAGRRRCSACSTAGSSRASASSRSSPRWSCSSPAAASPRCMTNGNLQVFKNPEFQFIGLGRVLRPPVPGRADGWRSWSLAAWVLRRTVFGRQILAIGGNEARGAARRACRSRA